MSAETETLLLASQLLTYPDERLLERLPELSRRAADLPTGPRRRIESFLRYLSSTEEIERQEAYVAAFDLAGGVPLYLTYPRFKDDRERGRALIDLKRRYRAAGLEPATTELPDFLPMFLEFLGLAKGEPARALAGEYALTVRGIATSMRGRSSPYLPLLEASADATAAIAARSAAAPEAR